MRAFLGRREELGLKGRSFVAGARAEGWTEVVLAQEGDKVLKEGLRRGCAGRADRDGGVVWVCRGRCGLRYTRGGIGSVRDRVGWNVGCGSDRALALVGFERAAGAMERSGISFFLDGDPRRMKR